METSLSDGVASHCSGPFRRGGFPSGLARYAGPSGFARYAGPSGFARYAGPSGFARYAGPSGLGRAAPEARVPKASFTASAGQTGSATLVGVVDRLCLPRLPSASIAIAIRISTPPAIHRITGSPVISHSRDTLSFASAT